MCCSLLHLLDEYREFFNGGVRLAKDFKPYVSDFGRVLSSLDNTSAEKDKNLLDEQGLLSF